MCLPVAFYTANLLARGTYLQISDADVHEAHKSASVADNWRL